MVFIVEFSAQKRNELFCRPYNPWLWLRTGCFELPPRRPTLTAEITAKHISTQMKHPPYILPLIIFSQFCGTSLWFAGNGVMSDLVNTFGLSADALAHLTSAVQFGFISGTLVFALLTIADRFSPSAVFGISALIAAGANLAITWEGHQLWSLLMLRFATGFFLAGIYPVGMKIAADYYQKGLGKSLGYLVGALVLGTAFPHLLKSLGGDFPWKAVLWITTGLAVVGGLSLWLLVPDGPHRTASKQLDLLAFFKVFQKRDFRAAAFGYFGHMWELYAFWAFVPLMLETYAANHPAMASSISLLSFCIIALGGPACVIGGYLSLRYGSKTIATIALALSGLCCLCSPLFFQVDHPVLFLGFLLFWGMVVIADSPLFSTMVAQNAVKEIKGTALTIVNCIGFSITIISIQFLNLLKTQIDNHYLFLLLALGPAVGLWVLSKEFART